MKQLFIIAIAAITFTSCQKEIGCIGSDCVYPEAVVTIDSIYNKIVYTTLINSDGQPFACPLAVSPEIDLQEFIRFTGFDNSNYAENHSESAGERVIKVYYVSADQSYVRENTDFVNAFKTTLEIEAFGDDLPLSNEY